MLRSKSVQVLGEGSRAEQHKPHADEPGNRPESPKRQAEQANTSGKHPCRSIRGHAAEGGQHLVQGGEVEVPAGEHERPDGASQQRKQARQEQRHAHRSRRRQRHFRWNLDH